MQTYANHIIFLSKGVSIVINLLKSPPKIDIFMKNKPTFCNFHDNANFCFLILLNLEFLDNLDDIGMIKLIQYIKLFFNLVQGFLILT